MKLKDLRNEIKGLDMAALVSRAKALKLEISDLVLDKNISKLKNLKSISNKKKELARVMTVLNQKKLIETIEMKDSAKSEKTEEGGKK